MEYEVEMEREEAEKALDKSKEWRERQMTEVVEKHDAEVRELLEQIKILERNSSNTEKKLYKLSNRKRTASSTNTRKNQ